MRNIILVSELIGPYDLLAIAPVADLTGVRILVEEVRKAPNVQRVEVTLISDTTFPVNPSFGRILSKKCKARTTS